MGWHVQAYDGEVHIVPDTEPGHVLAESCWCTPTRAPDEPLMLTHHDEADRILEASR